MRMHPLERLGKHAFRVYFAASLAGTLLTLGVMVHLARGFEGRTGVNGERYGIIAFEFARTPAKAAAILETWGQEGAAAATVQTWADFAFILAYMASLSGACIWVVRRYPHAYPAWRNAGRAFAWGMLLAGLCDVVENMALLQVLSGAVEARYTQTAYGCALIKFIIVGAALVYFLGGGVGVLFRLDKIAGSDGGGDAR